MKIKWAIPALEDLQNLHAYIADDNPRAAGKVVSKVRAAVTMLGSHPKMGRAGRGPYLQRFYQSPFFSPYRDENKWFLFPYNGLLK